MGGGSYIRNFTTVMPFLSLFFGVFVFFIVDRLKIKQGVFFVIFLIALNFPSIANSITLSVNYLKPWNRDILQNWVDKNIPENSLVRVGNININYNVNHPLKIVGWDHTDKNSISELQDSRDEFAIINTDWYQLYTFWFGSTSPAELIRYQGIPFDKLKGTYYGLALSEFKRYTVYEIYKPWQAPDNNYLVIKIPRKPEEKKSLIKEFTFDKGLEDWEYQDFSFNKGQSDISWSKIEGKFKIGSIKLNGGVVNGENSRFNSPFIKINPGRTYVIEGFIKPNKILPNQRDGFLRVDFFDKTRITSQSIFTAISGRVYGSDWMKEEITVEAPKEAHYLTVSFQRSNVNPTFHYFIDDVAVYESGEKLQETFKNIPYITPSIPDNVVFANSVY